MTKNYIHLIDGLDECRSFIRVAAMASESREMGERNALCDLLNLVDDRLTELSSKIDEAFHEGQTNGQV